jgi:hypothetical protein
MKNYLKFLSKLTSQELASYIIETGRSNGVINLTRTIDSFELAIDSSNILARSFDFKNSVAGPDYWAKVFYRLHAADSDNLK